MSEKTAENVDSFESKEMIHDGDYKGSSADQSRSAVTEILTDGFMECLVPNLDNLQERLNELTLNQGILIETMQQENGKFTECPAASSLAVMLSYVRTYHSKLTRIKQDMNSVEDRIARLKRRALKLRFQKEKEERSRAEAHERQLELERQLTAKLAPKHK